MLNTSEKIIKHKVGLSNLIEELGNVLRAGRVVGISQDPFYHYQAAVMVHTTYLPAYSQLRMSNELCSSIPKPSPRRPTAFASASTRPSCVSSTRSRFARSCIRISTPYSQTWMNGSCTAIMTEASWENLLCVNASSHLGR